ncbi:uncharacterized protein LOC130993046 [Salvia miltiorrhiza]|uniref:uncharacterized protein LOC130993046 n=1 Tax=Salvia miltiorrhiza TaxID=226208 RepID=UPI0025AB97D4|nr:uncharacterized protein LOC130993046 [Salvia miltiorrhiza]
MENPLLLGDTIERIQSFLNGKEAARTTILSKSWYSAWSTRPNLDFDQRHFRFRSADQFLEFPKTALQRYEDLNLKIHSFRLLMVESHRDASLAKELVAKAVKLGAVDLDFTSWNPSFVLPEELLRSEALAALSLAGTFEIDLALLNCSKLKSLTLSVTAKCDLVRDLIWRFPSLERLKFDGHYSLCDAEGRRSHPFFDDRLNRLEIQLEFGFRSLRLEFDKLDYEFQKLEYMYLGHLLVDGNLFSHASVFSKFPSLKELVIWDCYGFKDIRICSKSVERISIGLVEERSSYVTELDVPNMRKLEFEGLGWSRLALKKARSEWESDIRLTCIEASSRWFGWLDGFLESLRGSKISLCVKVKCDCRSYAKFEGLSRGVLVENLRVEGGGVYIAGVVHMLFRICRPKVMIREYISASDPVYEFLLEMVCKRVIGQVNVETCFDDGRQFIRFQLIWVPI